MKTENPPELFARVECPIGGCLDPIMVPVSFQATMDPADNMLILQINSDEARGYMSFSAHLMGSHPEEVWEDDF